MSSSPDLFANTESSDSHNSDEDCITENNGHTATTSTSSQFNAASMSECNSQMKLLLHNTKCTSEDKSIHKPVDLERRKNKRPLMSDEEVAYGASTSEEEMQTQTSVKQKCITGSRPRRHINSKSEIASKSEDCNGPRGDPIDSFYHMSIEHPGSPVVSPSDQHTVLVRLPLSSNVIPSPYPKNIEEKWDSLHVRMPYSTHNQYITPGDGHNVCCRWEVISSSLSKEISSVSELLDAVLSYNVRYSSKWCFSGLKKLINEEFTEEESDFFFKDTLPKMCKLALRLPELVTVPPPLLQCNMQHSVTLSQLQISSLLANAFFCTFPRRNAKGHDTEYARYPDINFNRLLCHNKPRSIEKIKCILNYFRMVTKEVPSGIVTVSRLVVESVSSNVWQRCTSTLPRLYCHHKGYIEDMTGLLQVDFANKRVGGGVLGLGCVQEEIRFVLCPELLITRLLTEQLQKNEALLIIGVEQFNKGTGYADSFKWNGPHHDVTLRDAYNRRLCQLVAIDALHFSRSPAVQYEEEAVLRELNKACAGFTPLPGSKGRPVAVATGNWGCGAFRGDPRLKALIQMAVCGYTRRDMVYLTFSDHKLMNTIAHLHQFLCNNNVNVGQLTQCLFSYGRLGRRVDGSDLLVYIHHCFTQASSGDSSRSNSPLPHVTDQTDDSERLPQQPQPPSSYVKGNASQQPPGNKKITDYFCPKEKRSKDSMETDTSVSKNVFDSQRPTTSGGWSERKPKNKPVALTDDEIVAHLMDIDEGTS